MADFFREVDEDVRRDQLIDIWKRYQNWIIGAAILVVLGTGGWRFFDYQRLKAAEAAGGRFAAAEQLLSDGKNAAAAEAFAAIAKDAPAGYATLAQLARANALAAQDPKAGTAAYDEVAANSAVDPAYQEVARLRGAYLRVDSDDPKAFEQRYAAYAGPDSPYRNAYRELLALADTRRGDFESAAHWFDLAAADPSSPPALRARADAFLTIVQAGPVPTK
jgi:hypothetical protein